MSGGRARVLPPSQGTLPGLETDTPSTPAHTHTKEELIQDVLPRFYQ